jgi:hypothetical protein
MTFNSHVDIGMTLNEFGVPADIIESINYTVDRKAKDARLDAVRAFYNRPGGDQVMTRGDFADEMHELTLRLHGLDIAFTGLREATDSNYPMFDGVHQIILDVRQNALRLEETFDAMETERTIKKEREALDPVFELVAEHRRLNDLHEAASKALGDLGPDATEEEREKADEAATEACHFLCAYEEGILIKAQPKTKAGAVALLKAVGMSGRGCAVDGDNIDRLIGNVVAAIEGK